MLEKILRTGNALIFALATFSLASGGCTQFSQLVRPANPVFCEKKHENYTQKYCTVVHEQLDLEEVGLGATESDYEVLDDIMDRLIHRFKNRFGHWRAVLDFSRTIPLPQEARVINFFKTIDNFLLDEGIQNGHNYLINSALKKEEKEFSCIKALIYLAIAELNNLPLTLVMVRNHLLVRWNFSDSRHINWDVTNREEITRDNYRERIKDGYYIDKYRIHEDSIKNGVYLRNLTKEEVLGVVIYSNIGVALCKKDEWDRGIEFFNKSLRLNPKNPVVLLNTGAAWLKKGNPYKAVWYFNETLRLDPNYSKARKARDFALKRIKSLASARLTLNNK